MKKIDQILLILLLFPATLMAQSFMINPYDRDIVKLLNGKWNVIIDRFNNGENSKIYQNRKPQSDDQNGILLVIRRGFTFYSMKF